MALWHLCEGDCRICLLALLRLSVACGISDFVVVAGAKMVEIWSWLVNVLVGACMY
jgi:hypothetical protein